MPSEMRQIMFRGPEIAAAIAEYHRRRSIALPAGNAVRCAIEDRPALQATLFFETGAEALVRVPINGETLAASLILHCISRGVPLPANADKRLHKVSEDGVALIISKRPH